MEGFCGLLFMALYCMMFSLRSYKAFNFWGIHLWNIHLPVALQPLAPVVPIQVMAPLAAFSFLPQDLWVSLEFSVAAFHSKWHRHLGFKHCWHQSLSHVSPMQMAGSLAFHPPCRLWTSPGSLLRLLRYTHPVCSQPMFSSQTCYTSHFTISSSRFDETIGNT